jgi:SAM-dependent methyltransferase
MKSGPIVAILLLALMGAVGGGIWLWSDHAQRRTLSWRDEGHRLYWQVRRTDHVHEDWELVMQLFLRTDDRDAVIERLAIQPGDQVADIGCGTGFYTLALARRAGTAGKVYGVDIQQESLAFLQERIASHGCEGCAPVELVHNRMDDAGLPPASVDTMLMAHLDFYAYAPLLPENQRMIASSAAALRPGARLLITQDLRPIPGGAVEHMVANFEAAGLELAQPVSLDNDTATLLFRKPSL